MAAFGDAEVDSLRSEDIEPPMNGNPFSIDHEASSDTEQNVPRFQLNIEVCDTDSTHQPVQERPRSVLSIFRPTSILSRAKSAFSTRSVIPKNVRSFVKRLTNRLKKRDSNASLDTSSSSSSYVDIPRKNSADLRRELDSLYDDDKKRCCSSLDVHLCAWMKSKLNCKYSLDPHGYLFFLWMALVFLSCVYNYLFVPLRGSFGAYLHTIPGVYAWLTFDYMMDLVYFFDMVAIQPHLSFCCNGVQETNPKVLALRYIKHWSFVLDIASLLPLDLLYIIPYLRFKTLLRLPRLLKFRSISVFMDRFEKFSNFPNIFRIAKLSILYLYIIHIYTCIYYTTSSDARFSDNWVYKKTPNATFITSYLYCFYWSTLAVATINLPGFQWPASTTEYVLAMAAYLMGIFIVASIIGEISNIVAAANSQKMAFRRRWDHLKECMRIWKIPAELQSRVQVWHDYACSQQLMLDERKVLDFLPKKMKGDIAIHVHLDVLSKVTLFQDFEKTLLRELVLKLRPALFVPGDYICKKGEIGKEMYIVNHGIVQVMGGATSNEVLAELEQGSVFGEISLLTVGGGNRRTAHVRAKGFSTLLLLSKKDLHETLLDYPDAQETLKKKARYLLRQDKKREHRQSLGSTMGVATKQGQSSNRLTRATILTLTSAARAARNRDAAAARQREAAAANIITTPSGDGFLHGSNTRDGILSVGETVGNAIPHIKVTGDLVPPRNTAGGHHVSYRRGGEGPGTQSRGGDGPGTQSRGVEGPGTQFRGGEGPGTQSRGGEGPGTQSRGVEGAAFQSRRRAPHITISSLAAPPSVHIHTAGQSSSTLVVENTHLTYTPLMPMSSRASSADLPNQCSSDEPTSNA